MKKISLNSNLKLNKSIINTLSVVKGGMLPPSVHAESGGSGSVVSGGSSGDELTNLDSCYAAMECTMLANGNNKRIFANTDFFGPAVQTEEGVNDVRVDF